MTKRPLTFFSVLLCGLSLAGCGGSSDGNQTPVTPPPPVAIDTPPTTISEAIEQLNQSGELPQLDRTDTLTGIDGDSNGIRDDIDNYLDSLSLPAARKTALEVFAADLQAIQSMDLNDPGGVESLSTLLAQSVVCLSAAYDNPADAHAELTRLEAYTANTPERAQQYIDYNAARDGSVTRLPSTANCQ